MGEFAKYKGEAIKIGTCEEMYYLRLDQRGQVEHIPGNVDVRSDDVYDLRFRLPLPCEDDYGPGEFDNPGTVPLDGYAMPASVKHLPVQFSHGGYIASLTCPESLDYSHGIRFQRDSRIVPVHLASQKLLRDGRVVPVLKCSCCGSKWREEDAGEIAKIVAAIPDPVLAQRIREGAEVGSIAM